MWVGVGRLVLDFYNNDDLKEKRRQLESLCKQLQKKFNISILEVADEEDPERCVVGFAVVMPEGWHEKAAQSFIQKITETVDQISFARLSVEDCDLFVHGET
jgi:uncharacterized protein YlxP (DUF503 family)